MPKPPLSLSRCVLAGLLLIVVAASARAQSSTEIIRGRIFGPDSLPVADAEILVTGLVTRATQMARTDAKGVYTLVFANPEGDYIVAVRRLGYSSTTFRLSRTGISGMLGADIYLKLVPTVLDRVVVSERTLPPIDRAAIGEQGSSALADSLFMADPARLMQWLLSIPGIIASGDSAFSVLGAATNQNITTLDGASARNVTLPPDALASTRVITSSADPSRGGFAGATVAQTLRGGTDIFAATIRGSVADRSLAWTDPAWTQPLARNMGTSGTANGPIVKGKLRYNVSWNVGESLSDMYSLLSPRPTLLSQQGIGLDTVLGVRGALRDLGVPFGSTRDARTRNFNSSEVLDWTPNATTSIRLSHSGNAMASYGGANFTSFPTRANESMMNQHMFNARISGFVRGLLNEMTLAYRTYSDDLDPTTLLPSGTVRVGTDFQDGRTGLASLGFGGGQGDYYENSSYGEVFNELSWLPKSGKHKVKVGGRLAFDQSEFFWFPGSNLLGSYTYLTLDDLVANTPARYDRVISNTPRHTQSRNSALWVGEEWAPNRAWQMQSGLRFDFAHPSTIPKYNPAVERTFGVRTDNIPSDVGVSPRLGFSWSSPARRGQGTAGAAPTLGGIPASAIMTMPPEMVTAMLGMQRGGGSTLPGIGVSGTIGAYKGVTSTAAIASYVESTGLPGTRVNLSCVGAAVPIPDWGSMTEGPTACADGTTGSNFSIAKPLVSVFDPSYRAPLSWRGNLSVDGIRVPHKWILGVNGVLAYNMHGESAIDLNLNRTPHFGLPAEANRPFYAPLNAIVPASGSVSPAASRISPDFSTVSSAVSDLRAVNAHLQASLAPPNPVFNRRVTLNFGYSLSAGRSQARGSSRVGTPGDPFQKRWVPIAQPSHSLRFTASGRVWWFNFGVNTYLYSGIPLTPMVSGDINGDGSGSNDRAFIPNPATTSDTSLARQLTELISHARPAARDCLRSQFDRMAGANTCRTPWQGRFDLTASITPPASWGYNDRLRLTMNVMNASGALVRALKLEETPLGQSSLSTTPNATLLYVTGFDPATQQFRYRVNQLFGEPTNYGSLRRRFGPTQVSIGMEYRFGGPPLNPIARGLGLRESVNAPALSDAERRAAVAKLRKDPVAQYVARKDSLGLTNDQVAQFESLRGEFNARADTALKPLTNWVLRKGQRIFDQDLNQRLGAARASLTKLDAEFARRAQAVLTEDQVKLFSAAGPAKKQ